MTNTRLVKFQQRNIRMLKKDYGSEITIYELVSATTNLDTGVKTATYNSYPISRAVVLPAHAIRAAIQSISLISVNKKVVQGGTFDAADRTFLIDRADVPDSLELKKDDWIEYNGRRYDIKTVDHYEEATSWLVSARRIDDVIPELHYRSPARTSMALTQNASVVQDDSLSKSPQQVVMFEQTADVDKVSP